MPGGAIDSAATDPVPFFGAGRALLFLVGRDDFSFEGGGAGGLEVLELVLAPPRMVHGPVLVVVLRAGLPTDEAGELHLDFFGFFCEGGSQMPALGRIVISWHYLAIPILVKRLRQLFLYLLTHLAALVALVRGAALLVIFPFENLLGGRQRGVVGCQEVVTRRLLGGVVVRPGSGRGGWVEDGARDRVV